MSQTLRGKKGLIVGIANDQSIAWGCAKAFKAAGAELAITYVNNKAHNQVYPLAKELGAPIVLPLDVRSDAQFEDVFDAINAEWGRLDFLLHSIAFAPKEDLRGNVTDCTREGFLTAMNISCYSLIRMAHFAKPLMKDGGCVLTVSYYGGERVVDHYNIMGPVKAALEGAVKYLAVELGRQNIRVNALSPGPILTRAASGITNFDELVADAQFRSPNHEIPSIDDVGALAAFLVSDPARHVTGNINYVDCGYHVIA